MRTQTVLRDVKPTMRNIIQNTYGLFEAQAEKYTTVSDYEASTVVEMIDKPYVKPGDFKSGPKTIEKFKPEHLDLKWTSHANVKLTERTPHKDLNEDGTEKNAISEVPRLNKVLIRLQQTVPKKENIDSQLEPAPNVKKTTIKY